MTRPLLVVAVLSATLAAGGTAGATDGLLDYGSAVESLYSFDPTLDPPPNDPNRDVVVGGAQDAFNSNVGLSAHSGPLGEAPFGHVSLTQLVLPTPPFNPSQVRLRVICLAVAGNLAVVGGIVTESSSNNAPPGTGFIAAIRDSMVPGGAGDGLTVQSGPAAFCPFLLGMAAVSAPIVHGNLLVHDAPG